ncbi:hypothetical protein F7D01_07315 [Erythrobacter sp. 3-20A1M]|uniref:head-tail connector protein n=1 Tax=Erythrobacter sp. 3-20A1M TaxID=2653850 RepID=UPI001BFC205C|nr:hypothetical protein [Erythrobacter sp. 3-20A1M]QWC56931.1 hypothetical protein F7D01_07315 [Erythrobacter sp. 3-20A1M]
MQRTFITPPDPGAAALAELKHWLAITTTGDDAALAALLRTAAEACEAFTGVLPLVATAEETLPASGEWRVLGTRPVLAITQVEGVPADGPAFPFAADAYAFDIAADGTGHVRLLRQGAAGRVRVRFDAGLAATWSAVPDGLRHGMLRLAAHLFRERVEGGESQPPAAIAALWQPWRRMRLA